MRYHFIADIVYVQRSFFPPKSTNICSNYFLHSVPVFFETNHRNYYPYTIRSNRKSLFNCPPIVYWELGENVYMIVSKEYVQNQKVRRFNHVCAPVWNLKCRCQRQQRMICQVFLWIIGSIWGIILKCHSKELKINKKLMCEQKVKFSWIIIFKMLFHEKFLESLYFSIKFLQFLTRISIIFLEVL